MRVLLVSDEEDPYLWDYYRPGCVGEIDFILSAGDLKPQYLSFLVTMINRPVIYIHGNHDTIYDSFPPEGCDSAEDTVLTVKGVRILGLGGCSLYNGGNYQYTERQMKRRIRHVKRKIKKAGGVDIILTHAPVAGFGDDDTACHRGFDAFRELIDEYKPKYLVHGHVHQSYSHKSERLYQYNETQIVNAFKRYILEFE